MTDEEAMNFSRTFLLDAFSMQDVKHGENHKSADVSNNIENHRKEDYEAW